MLFLDWVNMAQRFPFADLPIVGDGVTCKAEKLESFDHEGEQFYCVTPGEKFRFSVPSRSVRGSHETAVRVRSDGSIVTLSGNPGRYGRPDNVFNYDLQDTVEIANSILAGQGLPAFTGGVEHTKSTLSERDHKLGLWSEYSGAVFREMHATRNYATGNEAIAKEWMAYAGGLRAARISKGRFGDETVVFGRLAGKGRPLHKAIVVYRKASEMLVHAGNEEKRKVVKASQEYELARDTGLVRIECKWGSHFLRDNGLRYLGGANMGKIISIFDRETAFLLDASPDRAARVVSELPSKLRGYALLWIRGEALRPMLPKTTFYRVAKQLRDYGLDVSERRYGATANDAAEQELSTLLARLPKFELRTMDCPDWYGLPEVERRVA